jgi:hypothetical protein
MLASVRPPRAENISGNAGTHPTRGERDASRRAERSRGIRRRATGDGRPAHGDRQPPHHDTDIEIYISGARHHDGSVTRDIVVHELHHDHPITVEQGRRLAAALTEAADEAVRMAGCDRITVS